MAIISTYDMLIFLPPTTYLCINLSNNTYVRNGLETKCRFLEI